ncbi:uncharacterized protein F4822DRAFT_84435 [Hypoxylon trugodes]|uniref:uncharacterized protein n=1 Tax=Hypoxylon trugodes TaxID=326681 RepID=UPI00218E8152|nr:uncharacterized protein F4822DRAFT_84435 [Hypoxylon trugodes]KAI1383670.1 hypothetical protein F4822DRAFT_84435 [Hypoxylon trugodes]
MTRKLPRNRSEIRQDLDPAQSTPVRQQKIKRDDSDAEDKVPENSSVSKRVKRSGSASAPPEPLPESHMIEGLENDDIYRMVEDEFLETARQFTAHLHAAEYLRLKSASESQNADTIKNISRPVVGRTTDLVKTKQERRARLQKQRAAVRKARLNSGQDEETEESGDESQQNASLFGLMESPRKQAKRLDYLTKALSTTRAAAGFDTIKPRSLVVAPRPAMKSMSDRKLIAKPILGDDSETEDDDDLDAPSTRVPVKPDRETSPSPFQLPKPKTTQSLTKDTQISHPAKPAPTRQRSEVISTKETDLSDENSDGGLFSTLKRRQEDRKRMREQRKAAAEASKTQSKHADDIIPGFI